MHTKSWTDFWRCISLASVFFIGRNTFGPATDSRNTARRSVGVLPNREVRRSMKKYFPQGGAEAAAFYFPICSFLPLLILPARPLAEYTFG